MPRDAAWAQVDARGGQSGRAAEVLGASRDFEPAAIDGGEELIPQIALAHRRERELVGTVGSDIDADDEDKSAGGGGGGERGLPIAEPYQCVGRDPPRRSGLDRVILCPGDLVLIILRHEDLIAFILHWSQGAIRPPNPLPGDLVRVGLRMKLEQVLGPIQGMARSHPDLLVQDVVPVFRVELGDGSPRVEEAALDAIDRVEAAALEASVFQRGV